MQRTILVALLLLVVGPFAFAAPAAANVDALIRRGAQLRVQGKHDEALQLFQQAHALEPSGRTLAQMGLAEYSLQRYVDAEEHLAAAVATDSPWVAKNRRTLEEALGGVRAHVAIVTLTGPAGAEVTMNGRPLGRLPLSEALRVAEGPLHFEATAPGRQPAVLDVPVQGGKAFQVTLDLPPVPPPPTVHLPTHAPMTGREAHPTEVAEAPGTNWRPWLGGGLLALSAGALTTGIVWLIIDGDGTCDVPAGSPPGTRCLRYYDTKTPGWIALGVGAASAVGGGLLLWRSTRAEEVHIGLSVAGALRISGRF